MTFSRDTGSSLVLHGTFSQLIGSLLEPSDRGLGDLWRLLWDPVCVYTPVLPRRKTGISAAITGAQTLP